MKNRAESYWKFVKLLFLQIYQGLHDLLGKKIPVGADNLTWTLLTSTTSESSSHDNSEDETSSENYKKLKGALDVLHECFMPIFDPKVNGDVIENAVFCRR